MRAIVYEKFQGPISVQNIEDPAPKSHGVVVKVSATGLCRSDWHGWMGHDPDIELPHVPGHELAGIVMEVGKDVKNFKVGDRVTVPFVCGCGTCPECHSGNHQVCDNQTQPGFTHWGSFITSFRAVVDQGKVQGGQFVAVHGCGGVGLSAIMIADALGATVIAVDIDNETLSLAKSLGAAVTINGLNHKNVVDEIKAITHGGVHVSIDGLGSQTTCFNSIANLRKRGKHIQVGLMTGDHKHPIIPMDQVLANELEVFGSHGMQAYKYPAMLEMIKEGRLKPERLVERTISLEEATMALPRMNQFENKGVLVINAF